MVPSLSRMICMCTLKSNPSSTSGRLCTTLKQTGVERLNSTLKEGLWAYLAEGRPFDVALGLTLLHIRATKHSTTGGSPDSLMIGRELNLSLDCLFPKQNIKPAAARQASVGAAQQRIKQHYDT